MAQGISQLNKMANPTSKNHYLPRFYLKQFANKDGKILRTYRDNNTLRERLFGPKGTGYIKDLYSFKDEGISASVIEKDYFERTVLGPIDNSGAIILKKLISKAPCDLTEEENEMWAVFLNSLLERHPQRIRGRDKKAVDMANEKLLELKRYFGTVPDGRVNVLDMVNVEAMAKNFHRKYIINELGNKKPIGYLKKFHLVKIKIKSSKELSFVTGDNPVVVNFGNPWPIHWYTISLSPNVLLLGTNNRQDIAPLPWQTIALAHNFALYKQCEYLFSRASIQDTESIKNRVAVANYLIPVDFNRNKKDKD